MVERTEYINILKQWCNERIIKVITGMRRCGKSTLLEQFKDYLLSDGISPGQIIFLNLDDLENESLLDYKELYKYLSSKIKKGRMTYIFLDEIQEVNEFQKVIDTLYLRDDVDIYITGSNASLLSGELATLLSGRYIEISLLPFSFKEFYSINSMQNKEEALREYIHFGGLPYLSSMNRTDEKANIYFEGIYNTVILKDIVERSKINDENARKITDVALLKSMTRYLSSVIGSPVSIKGITDYLTSNGRKISQNTVATYVESLTNSFIFYQCERFDIVGKQILKTNGKFYSVDMGLRNFILRRKQYDLGFTLENIVYLELLRRGYKVNIGKVGTAEIDFVAQKNRSIEYIQVCANLQNEDTFNREMNSLESVKDNYKKTILTADYLTTGNYNGIEVINLISWLLG